LFKKFIILWILMVEVVGVEPTYWMAHPVVSTSVVQLLVSQ